MTRLLKRDGTYTETDVDGAALLDQALQLDAQSPDLAAKQQRRDEAAHELIKLGLSEQSARLVTGGTIKTPETPTPPRTVRG